MLVQGDLTRQVLAGDAITLTGVYYPHTLPYFMKMRMRTPTTQSMFVEAHHIQKHKKGYSEASLDEDAMEHRIQEALAKGSLYEAAAKSIAPEIFGHQDVKKALLLVLIGSYTKQMQETCSHPYIISMRMLVTIYMYICVCIYSAPYRRRIYAYAIRLLSQDSMPHAVL